MYEYMKGTVTAFKSNGIVLEVSGIGYFIATPNPYAFVQGQEYKVFLHQQVKEDELNLYGFKLEEEKVMFLKLISVKGLGCKMALPILATGSIPGIMDAIERENLLYLKKFPKIGEKLAKQIVLDLKGKLGVIGNNVVEDNNSVEELTGVLVGLGYKEKEFKTILSKVDINLSLEEQIKEALKLLLK